jgi:predicted anti-sigma-YlaC factor YlaD
VKFHLSFCDSCKNYYAQSALMQSELEKFISNLQENPSHHLSEEKKKEMEKKIINQISEN